MDSEEKKIKKLKFDDVEYNFEELPEKVQRVARTFKQVLAERIRPIYEEVREEFATKL